MYTALVITILFVSVLLGLIVLVQNSKGGGLVSNFGGANQMMGVRQTSDFLEKATWTLGGILVVLCLLSSITLPKNSKEGTPKSELENVIAPLPTVETPAATTDMPASSDAPAEATEAPAEAPAE
ncbi:MAG: preprotein translocase subunit SecG [Bacteroidales bacterium]|nr:preprotein translocase subunit SecG [Bacteroidales bacterium]